MKEQAPPSEVTPPGSSVGERIRTACLVVIAVLLALGALKLLGGILQPLLIALFLFFLLRPLAEVVVARKVPRWFAYPLLFLIAGLFILLFGVVVYANALEFQERLDDYRTRVQAWADAVARWTGQANAQGHFDLEQRTVAEFFDVWHQYFRAALGQTLEFIECAVMVVFYLFFIFLEVQKLPRRLRRAYPPETAGKLLEIGRNIDDGIKHYLALKTVISLGLGATTGILAYLFGLDFWPLWAALAFLGNYITYVGSLAAVVPPIALAFVQFHSPWAAVALAVLLVANRFAWIDFVEIRYLGSRLNISPVLLLTSLGLFYWMWGVVGLVLAVPLITAAKIVLFNFERSRPFAIVASEE
jgi:predicted PurR-regulated permease PerM